MGKPAKIHKKKSFMFTVKHHSFQGILGLVTGVLSVIALIVTVVYSYGQAGNVSAKYGSLAMFTAILNITGVISGIIGVRERDVYIVSPIIAIVLNSLMLAFWVLIIILAM